jgi:alkanesulfonate monooxygenase SsuD/methylene tetrahydromethanopterin reductase-like flavin-dependent oxidoreductase (luciferase family)
MNPRTDQSLRFSIFDWLDESGRGVGQTYEERLRLLEYADHAGFYSYLLAEHHGTSLSTTPSPGIFLASAAQRTRRLRLGALTWLLPLYPPVRLLEELCMLDQLAQGRLEIGVSRGTSPNEAARHGITGDEMRPRFQEALAVLMQGFARGEINYRGEFYQFENLKIRLRPVQKPHPPLWFPTSNAESIPWIAAQGFNVVMSLLHAPSFEKVAEHLRRYRVDHAAHRNDADRMNGHVALPEVALTTHIYVADTDEQAMTEARAAYAVFHENFTRRYVEIGQGAKYANRPSFDQFVERKQILCGSSATVAAILASHLAAADANHFIGAFMFGSLTYAQMRRSLELFAAEVIPTVRARTKLAA